MPPTEAEIEEYQRRLARRRQRHQPRSTTIGLCFRYTLWLGALALVGGALDFLLALFYTVDGQSGAPISGTDMTTGVPLIGVVIYTGLLIIAWAVWHDPDVEKRRAVRRTVRARRAAEIGPEHPLRHFRVLHPYLASFLRTMLIFELLQLSFGRVAPRRR